jgi:exodeoxyribonuclease-3
VRTALGWPRSMTRAATSRRASATSAWCRFYIPSGSSGELRQGFKFEVMQWLAPILRAVARSPAATTCCAATGTSCAAGSTSRTGPATRRTPAACRTNATGSTGCAGPRCNGGLGRHLSPPAREGQDYTWWSNRGAARANNVGWRIDYQFVTPSLRDS